MGLEQMMRLMMGAGKKADQFPKETTKEDRAETLYIRPLPLLKMLRQASGGVPFEVMGILLGSILDEYSVLVKDVFHMPFVASTVAVEAHDHGFQTRMKELLEETGRREDFVGWYHSHPGYGCSLSRTDQETQASMQQLQPRAVAVVLDPVQSVRGRVVLDAFRLNDPLSGLNPFSSLLSLLNPASHFLARHLTSYHGLTDLRGPDHTRQLAKGLLRDYYKLIVRLQPAPEDIPILRHISATLHSRPSAEANAVPRLRSRKALAADIGKLTKYTQVLTRRLSAEKGTSAGAGTEGFGDVDARGRLIVLATRFSEEPLLDDLRRHLLVAALQPPRAS